MVDRGLSYLSALSRFFDLSSLDETEHARKAALLRSVIRAMIGMAVLGFVASLVDRRNDVRVGLVFYGLVSLCIFWLSRAVRSGRVVLAAWSVSAFVWSLIAFVTLFFGGLHGGNAACFAVVALLVGSAVSGRAGVAIAVLSSAWCAVVAFLEIRDALPPPLGPYSPVNSWAALTVSLILTTVLMRNALDSLRALHAKAVESALARDAALQRSIQAQKMELVGKLAGGVAHDFNNLLTIIGTVAAALRLDAEGGASSDPDLLDDLDNATERAVLMTRQLLSFSRTQRSELTDLDLDAHVRAFVPMLQRLVGPKVTIDVQSAPGAIVRATRVGLEQVLLNLAVNASDAMPEGGSLSLRVHVESTAVRLVVRDSGVGMDADTQARIFAPFFTTKSSGTGLGLATVREKVGEFGGTITVDSELGRGSTFEVRLSRPPERATTEPT